MKQLPMKNIPYIALLILVLTACREPGQKATNQQIQQLLDKSSDYISTDQFDSALVILYDLLPRLDADSLSLQRINAMKNIGIIYDIEGKYDSASYYLYKALRLSEQTREEKIHVRILCDLGILYFNLGKSGDAIAYYEQMLEMAQKQSDTMNIIRAMNNMGNTYATLDHDYEKAITCFENSIYLGEKTGFKEAVRMSKTTLVQIYSEKGELDKAYKLAIEIKDIYGENAYTDLILAEIYRRRGEQNQAINLYKLILERGTGFDTQELRLSLLDGLYLSYEGEKDYEHALKYYIRSRTFKDSLHNIQSEKNIQDLKIAYETEKKEIRIEDLEKEKRLTLWLGITGGAVLLLTLAFLIVRQRFIQQKVARLEKEKQLIATQAVLDGETAERTRLARDLHDGLGGMLSVVKLNLNDVKKGVSIESEDVVRFDRAMGLLDESIHELRRVAHNMMPDSLTHYGLRVSLNDFCGSIPGAVFNHYGSDERLDPKLEVMIYRTVHELVNNALKHASATEIIVQMIQESDRISITVQDNGHGFDPATLSSGNGLNNIRNRVGSYNGRMDVYSEPDKGTEVSVEFKL